MQSFAINERYERAKQISAILLREKRPLSFEEISAYVNDKCMNNESLEALISDYGNQFQLSQQPMVKLVTKIDICETHCTRGKKCTGPWCSGLHICKFYFLSGKCVYGQKCTYGHSLNQAHNKKVLTENLLTDISVEDLKYLLRLAHNRTAITVPRICKFYNRGKCKHAKNVTSCPDLHICRYFVSDECNYGNNCLRSHVLSDEANRKILQKHGMDICKSEQELIQELRSVLPTQNRRGSIKDSDSLVSTTPEELGQLSDSTGIVHTVKTEVIKREGSLESVSECKRPQRPELHVDLPTQLVHFRYMTEIAAIEKRSKTSRQTKSRVNESNFLADIWVEGYHRNATVLAYCVDSSGKIHPFTLFGENCTNGVYVTKCKLEPEKHVKLYGVYVCTPKIQEYENGIENTIAYLNQAGIQNVQRHDKELDKGQVNLKITVILEDNSVLNELTAPLRNKKTLKNQSGDLTQVQKRKNECVTNTASKRRRQGIPSDDISVTTPKPFERLYSRQGTTNPWGNFIDTKGYQASALTWKAQGDALQSVCMICYPGGSGTGFRVGHGKKYIMTAAHVYNYILESDRNGVGRQQRDPLRNSKVFAVFDYLTEGELTETNKFYFTGTVHFINSETDTVILELKDNRFGKPMPPAFQYFQTPNSTQEFFFVGHSKGKPLGINRVYKIVDIESKKAQGDIQNIKQMSLVHTKCPEFPTGREYEVQPFQTLNNPHRFLFHCKFTKGASGSPGLVFLNDGRIVVVSMLLRGYPDWFYDPNPSMDEPRNTWFNYKDQWCVEQGVNLESVYNLIHKTNPALAKEVFCHERV